MQATPTDRNTAAKSSVAIIATFGCLACLFFLIAATIVLALIPIYTASKSVTVNSDARRSKQVELILSLDSSTRRRRVVIENGTYDDASLDSTGRADCKSLMRPSFPSYVRDLDFTSGVITQCSLFGKKRRSLSRRAVGSRCVRFLFYIVYQDSCPANCQVQKAAALQDVFRSIRYSNIFLNRQFRFLTKSGGLVLLPLFVVGTPFISAILPGIGSATPSYSGTTTSTVATVTSSMNG